MKENFDNNLRQIQGFEQVLRTPPAPGEPTRKYRDYNGVLGEEVVWSDENKRWTFTGVQLGKIPPKEGEPTTKTDNQGRTYTWNSEKGRWWCTD